MYNFINRIIYWVITIAFCVGIIAVIVMIFQENSRLTALVTALQIPKYFLKIGIVCMIVGMLELVYGGRLAFLKDWAYAGFTFLILGGMVSMVIVGQPYRALIAPGTLLALLEVSYIFWYKIKHHNASIGQDSKDIL